MREYLDRPRERLMESFDDPWELAAILCAADRRLGRACPLGWRNNLDADHPARLVLAARFGHGHAADGSSDVAKSQSLPTRPRHAVGRLNPLKDLKPTDLLLAHRHR
jgi:hypothetical protein